MSKHSTILAIFIGSVFLWPCGAADNELILQSTTSTRNSGLLDYLLPMYEEASGVTIRAVAVGTGQALKNGRNGDGDVLLVHAKAAEEEFVAEGYGVARHDVMYNDFVIVGPKNDPAGLRDGIDVIDALSKIANHEALFASRGDDSGTHTKELALWRATNVDVAAKSGEWYRETGSGMGATLNVAAGINAYALTDRATWISFKNKANMDIVFEGDEKLFNQYGVIVVSPERHPHVKANSAQAFVDWLLGDTGQQAIAAFRVNGEQLFYPNAQSAIDDVGNATP